MREIEVGKVEDYFSKIGVVAIKVTAEGIKVGVSRLTVVGRRIV